MTKQYIIKQGDTLWDISAKFLGSPFEWPRLWRYNNRKEVVAITRKPIVNPDLIYPGQKLLIPTLGSIVTKPKIISKPLVKPKESLQEQLPKIKSPISLSYRLDDITQAPIILPNAIVEIKITGNICLSSTEAYPVNYVVNDENLEATVTSQANAAFSSLLAETKLAYDDKTKSLTIGSKIVSKSTTPNVPSTAVGVEISSNSPIPKLQYEVRFPQLKGRVNEFNYIADKVTFVLEVTMRDGESAKPLDQSPQPVSSPSWDKVFAIGLFAGATIIVVGTLIEDYVTFGVGAADDPASFAAAAGMSAKGALLWGAANVVVQRAVLPAMVRFSTSIVPIATLRYAH